MAARREIVEALNVNHPGSRTPVDAAKYRAVREAMLRAVPATDEGIAFQELPAAVQKQLPGGRIPGGGSIGWYTTTVKLDLEARGLIERIPGSNPQRLRRTPNREA
ncbi:MAG: hypothetical protein Kow0010_11080 [Dehalococcoidia bacterium]